MPSRRSVLVPDCVSGLMAAGCLSGGAAALAIGLNAHVMIVLAGGISALCWVLAGGSLIARGLRR